MIGTPMYNGQCYQDYVNSMLNNVLDLRLNKIGAYWIFLGRESLITRGRNNIAYHFLKSDCSHLMFIDGDISFPEGSIRKLLDANKDIIGVPYPKKIIDWDRINFVSQNNRNNSIPLQNFAASYVVNYLDTNNTNNHSDIVEVSHIGTGFMLVKREVFEKLLPHMEKTRDANFGIHDVWYTEFFKTEIDKQTGTFMSEDWSFCNAWSRLGGKIYAMPSINLSHTGTYVYTGNFNLTGPNIN
jgi:hypothetical protein